MSVENAPTINLEHLVMTSMVPFELDAALLSCKAGREMFNYVRRAQTYYSDVPKSNRFKLIN